MMSIMRSCNNNVKMSSLVTIEVQKDFFRLQLFAINNFFHVLINAFSFFSQR
jgi:hypothetical protein